MLNSAANIRKIIQIRADDCNFFATQILRIHLIEKNFRQYCSTNSKPVFLHIEKKYL